MTVVTQAPARSGRWSEALLLLLAIAAGFGAFTLSYWGLGFEGFPDQLPRLLALTVGTALVAHLLIRKFAPYADPVLFPSALALNGIGLAMIYRIDVSQGASKVHGQFMLTFVGIALAVATVIVLRDHRLLRRFTWTSLVVGIILLLLPLVPGSAFTSMARESGLTSSAFLTSPPNWPRSCWRSFSPATSWPNATTSRSLAPNS